MDPRERIALIEKSKSVHGRSGISTQFQLHALHDEFVKSQGTCGQMKDVYPVRAIAILEVFTRGWAARLVDHSPEFAERAIPALQNFKLDYSVLLSITGKLITFGDIVAFAISVNRLDQIISIFTKLCATEIVPLLKDVVDPYKLRSTRSGKEPAKPIIADYDRTAKALTDMFELRHVICHEAPFARDLDLSRLECMLNAAVEFATALEEVLLRMLFGTDRPVTQSEMNAAAYKEYKHSAERLQATLAALYEQYKDNPERLGPLKAGQKVWEQYVGLQTDFCYNDKGTIGPTLRAMEMQSLTKERQKRLEPYVGNEYL